MLTELDPFDLPEWLGVEEVTWTSEAGIDGHIVRGRLRAGADHDLHCDLMAVDQAYPSPVVDEATRRLVHQAWRHGQVWVGCADDRTTLAAPGTSYDVEQVLTALTRLARAVGADPQRWSVRLSLAP